MVLLERELWNHIVDAVPQTPDATWKRKDGKARAVIGLSIEDSQKIHIRKLSTAKGYWDALKTQHEKSNLSNQVSLLRQHSSKRMNESQSMENHITEFLELVAKLEDLGEEFPEHKVVSFLLGSLPVDYNVIVKALEVRPENDLTLEMVKEKLMQEAKRRMGNQIEKEIVLKTRNEKQKFNPKCYSCGSLLSVPKLTKEGFAVTFEGDTCKITLRGVIQSGINTLDLVRSDLCGPMQNCTPNGNRYFLTLIDDKSRYCTVYFLRNKSDDLDKVKDFVAKTETLFGKHMKVFRTDRGGEFCGNEMQKFLKSKGIMHQLTAPYTPEQNGVSERKNRSLMEMARFDANMDLKYWAEAVNTANYLQNRLPSSTTEVTPYEEWYCKKPNMKHIKVFGSIAYAHITKKNRRKLDAVSKKYIFVGYSEETKGHRLLNTEDNTITISRDVAFIENSKSNNMSIEEISLDNGTVDTQYVVKSEEISTDRTNEVDSSSNVVTSCVLSGDEQVYETASDSSTSDEEVLGTQVRVSSRSNKGKHDNITDRTSNIRTGDTAFSER
ncbi:uncharacterized protein LOC142230880 [Haematobia irritans]|uniref:uncharacterized protein LOC142230880 n=1 Tax=Haematobia irritans TaxID=7368 RepID=UPI003F501461